MENELKITKIADSLHGTIEVSSLEKRIISTQVFNRLHNIFQNSTVYLTYPANKTKRFEHSLGVLHLSGQMLYNSIVNADKEVRDDFLECCSEEIGKIINDSAFADYVRKGLKNYAYIAENYKNIEIQEPLIMKNTPKVVEDEHHFVYCVIYQALRVAALLHDIGHPPFSHVSEYALNDFKKYVFELEDDKNERQKEFSNIIEKEKSDKKLHEAAGLRISDRLLAGVEVLGKFVGDIEDEEDAKLQLLYFLVRKVTMKILKDEAPVFKNLHYYIVDGPIDCDRLDYVSRDMENSGFDFGRIEYDRLVNSMKLLKKDSEFYFCPDIRVLSTIEDFFQRRWSLHKYVIFHHRVIKTDHLLQNAVFELSKLYLDSEEDEAEKKDESNFIPLDISGLWKGVKETYSDDQYFDTLNQWDDSWLITVLRQEYFLKYYSKEDLISYQLQELLSNRKNYISMIKRLDDFREVDEIVKNNFNNSIIEEFRQKIEKTDEILNKGFFLKGIERVLKYADGFDICRVEDKYEKLITEAIEQVSKEKYEYKDCIVKFKRPNTGLEDPTYVYNSIFGAARQGRVI